MSKFFGKTWWGEQWLKSLSNIDYSNRLPRGVTYARNGSVKSIEISQNQISATVSGSRPKPYKISIVIPLFQKIQINKLVEEIAKRPVLVSKLLNKELDTELLTIAERDGLKVFPKQWSDFKMHCSCPDGAVPCKHLAAVIYTVSAEIDNNPFLVFELHGVDLAEELKRMDIFIKVKDEDTIPNFESLLLDNPFQKTKKQAKPQEEEFYKIINLSGFAPMGDALFQLLQNSPAFYQENSDFKSKYTKILEKIAKKAQFVLVHKVSLDTSINQGSYQYLRGKLIVPELLVLTHHSIIALVVNTDNSIIVNISDCETQVSLRSLAVALWGIEPSNVVDYQPSVAALRNSLVVALHLLVNTAVTPQIMAIKKQISIRWLPAMLSLEVQRIIGQIEFPAKILTYQTISTFQEVTVPCLGIISCWLNMLIAVFSKEEVKDLISELFFQNIQHDFSGPGERAFPGGIQAWLSLYYVHQGDFKPIIIVEEVADEQFTIQIDIEEHTGNTKNVVAINKILILKKYEKQRYEILQSLTQLGAFIPGLDGYINDLGVRKIKLNSSEFAPFLMQAIPVIRLLNVTVLLPKSLQTILKPKPTVKIKSQPQNVKSFIRMEKLLDFEWQVAIGDTVMNENDFRKLLKSAEGLIKFKTGYIYADSSDIEKLYKHFTSTKELSSWEMLQIAISSDYLGSKVLIADEVTKLLDELSKNEPVKLPKGITATLRPYQERGFSWMYRNAQLGFGAVLADDMGLGKTIQVITTILKYKEDGFLENEKVLIVVPTGLLTNWQAEIEKFAPSLSYKVYHGSNRKLDKEDQYDVLISTYGIVRSDASNFKKLKWQLLVIDEAQNIKNSSTAQSKALKSIAANTFVAMSGTPVENRLSELWSIMDYANRGFLGTLKSFDTKFGTPIESLNDAEAAQTLKKITSPFLMRRLKSDKSIIDDLPDKIEMDSFGYLEKEQASLYETTLQKAMDQIQGIEDLSDQKMLFKRQGLILQMILALKQICNHPTLFLKNKVMESMLSGKVALLFNKLESILAANEKVLIFTQFTEMGNLLKQFIQERFGEEPLFYHGGNTIKQRKEMVDAFQTNRADKIFILSLKAAGTGLNLTAANHVIHYDLWWNPAVEAQATDRAYRIGQKNNVMVHRFITKGTFEEEINKMIQSKKALADMTVSTGENWIGNLSNSELKKVFARPA